MDNNNQFNAFNTNIQNGCESSCTFTINIPEEYLVQIADIILKRITAEISASNVSAGNKLSEKAYLSMKEASEYFGIGQNKLRELANCNSECVLMKGNRKLIKREKFQKLLDNTFII